MAVYVFGAPGDLLVKIGFSGRADQREKELRRIMGRGQILYTNERAGGFVERRAHLLLRPRYWLDGEWFVCGADVAIQAIRRASVEMQRRRRLNRAKFNARYARRLARRAARKRAQ